MFELTDLTIQTFDDSKQGRKHLTKIFAYDLTLVDGLTQQGAGIFFCPNPQEDQTQRSIDHTKSLSYISLDLDVAKEIEGLVKEDIEIKKKELLERLKSLEIPPNYVIETKNGYQPVWELLKPIPLKTIEIRRKANDYYQRLVVGFSAKTGLKSEGDNLCRVIRLPNTFHQKDPSNPFKITVIKLNEFKPTLEEFIEIYPPLKKESQKVTLEESVSIPEGGRHNKLLRLADSLLSRKYAPNEVWLTLNEINKTYKEPLKPDELTQIFQDACQFIGSQQHNEQTSTIIIPNALEFLEQDFGSIGWLAQDLIPIGGSAIIVAKRESFKTWLALYLSYRISNGLPLWDTFNTIKTKTLYISNDDPPLSFKGRVHKFNFTGDFFVYHRALPDFSIDQENGTFATVKTLIEDKGIGLVIVDIVRNTHNKDSNTDKDVKLVFDKYKELRNSNPNLVFIFLIHPSKEQVLEKRFGGRQIEEAVGSYYWEASVDTVLSLTKITDEELTDKVIINVTKNKQSEKRIKPFFGIQRKLDKSVEFIYEEKIPDKLKIDLAKEFIKNLLAAGDLERQKIIDLTVERKICGSRLVEQALKELHSAGEVSHTDSKPHVYSLVKDQAQEDSANRNTNNDLRNAESAIQTELTYMEEVDEQKEG